MLKICHSLDRVKFQLDPSYTEYYDPAQYGQKQKTADRKNACFV